MQFFNKDTGRTIGSEEMIRRYGTDQAIPELGIYPLTYQPDYIPFAFNPLANDTYLPIKGDTRAEIDRLVEEGYTEAEATALLTT